MLCSPCVGSRLVCRDLPNCWTLLVGLADGADETMFMVTSRQCFADSASVRVARAVSHSFEFDASVSLRTFLCACSLLQHPIDLQLKRLCYKSLALNPISAHSESRLTP